MKMAVLNTDLTYTACPPIRYRELDLGCSFYKSSVLTFSFCSVSREGVTQGDPLAMALYGVALLPLAEHLRAEHPDVLQPWYADDNAMQGIPAKVAPCFKELEHVGPQFGYHPEADKSWGICPLVTGAAARAAFDAENLPVQCCRGRRYVGGFVGSVAMRNRWVEPMVAA